MPAIRQGTVHTGPSSKWGASRLQGTAARATDTWQLMSPFPLTWVSPVERRPHSWANAKPAFTSSGFPALTLASPCLHRPDGLPGPALIPAPREAFLPAPGALQPPLAASSFLDMNLFVCFQWRIIPCSTGSYSSSGK